ncbi:unspecific monooxygenase [Dictyocaulus viviparus]|uniref:Unspecific monooxygenase n=1 Tax=Dictyocaulus viviparus TaxID=29172 RepID=A0A0D8XYC6_DICVI|nr:unspecific monooxygenase [Dictyocaulus viviparus]
MGTTVNSQTEDEIRKINEQVISQFFALRLISKHSVVKVFSFRFPWLWLEPIWYLSGFQSEFNRLVKLTNDFTRKVIADRKRRMDDTEFIDEKEMHSNRKKLAFLDLLLHMQRSNELSDEDIREEVDTFMFEGHDTTSSGIGFTVWWLGQSPECQKKVHEELDSVFGDSDRLPTSEDLKRLVYLEKCIKESLRLTPSVPLVARKLTSDVVIGETTLPDGLTVVVVPSTTARDDRYWEKPKEFYPEHFDAEKVSLRNPYAYIPFSAGPRNCIGQKFAVLEEKTVLSWIFRRYYVESEERYPGNQPSPELVLTPSNGVRVRLTKR